MNLNPSRAPLYLTREGCGQLLAVVRPKEIVLASDNSNRFEALFDAEGLVSISFFLWDIDFRRKWWFMWIRTMCSPPFKGSFLGARR